MWKESEKENRNREHRILAMNLGYHGRIVRDKSERQTRARYISIEGLEKNSAQGVSNLRTRDVGKAPLGESFGRT